MINWRAGRDGEGCGIGLITRGAGWRALGITQVSSEVMISGVVEGGNVGERGERRTIIPAYAGIHDTLPLIDSDIPHAETAPVAKDGCDLAAGA